MKTTIRGWRNQHFKLVIDEPGLAPDKCAVLAVASLYEGLGVWTVEDIRLREHGIASPYFSVGADDYWAQWTAPNVEAAILAKGMIKESFPLTSNDSELDLNWCTFDGLVRGKTTEEAGVAKHMQNPAPLLHSYSEARAILRDIAEFWASWPHSESDTDIRQKVSATKIDNPWRQLREGDLRFSMTLMRIHQEQDEAFHARVAALPRLQKSAGAAYTLHQVAAKALQGASGDVSGVDWGQVHQDVFAKAVGQDRQPVAQVLEAIKRHSPGAVTSEQIAAVEVMGESRNVAKRILTPSEERGLTDEQKNYLNAHRYIVSLQPDSMLLPREQLYKTPRHGAVTIDRAIELDARLPDQQVKEPAQGIAHDNYSDAEDRFIDHNGMSSGLN